MLKNIEKEALNARIENRNKKNSVFIRDSKRIIKRFSKVGFVTNNVIDSLMYRGVDTQYITKCFDKKISDNRDNVDLLINFFREGKANFALTTSFASSGKTYTNNLVFNECRDWKKELDELFIKKLCNEEFPEEIIIQAKRQISKKINDALQARHSEFVDIKHKAEKLIKAENIKIKKLKESGLTECEIETAIKSLPERKKIDALKNEFKEKETYIKKSIIDNFVSAEIKFTADIKKKGAIIRFFYMEFELSDKKPISERLKKDIIKDFIEYEFNKVKNGNITNVKAINEYIEKYGASLVQIIVTPNRIQNEQNQEDEKYNYTAIIGQNGKQISFDSDTNYSVVIEKLTEVLNQIEAHPVKTKINLCIDEAHVLVEQKSFRSDAINKLIQVVARVLELDGTVLFMTATPENLKCFNFDRIISFIPVEDVKNADKIKIYMRSEAADFGTEENIEQKNTLCMHDYVVSVVNQLKNPLVRYNTKQGIERAKETLEGLGYKVETVTSDDKQKELFRSIVKNSALTKADKWICSSVIEVGTNIIGVVQDDGSIDLMDITPTYCLNNINQMSFDSIEQFFARVRYHVSEYALIMPDKRNQSEKETIQSVDTLLNQEISNVETFYGKLKELAAVIVKISNSRDEAISNVNKAFNSCESIDGKKYNCECIYFDEEDLEVKVDTISLWKNVYKKFIQQYYYHPTLFIKKLDELFGIEVEISEEDVHEIHSNKEINTQAKKDYAKNALQELVDNKGISLLKKVISKRITVQEITDKKKREGIEAVLNVKEYKSYFQQAFDLDLDFSKIVSAILLFESNRDIERYLQGAYYINGNKLFLKEGITLSIEHDIIMREFYKINSKGNLVERQINAEDITNISRKIGKVLNKKVKKCKNAIQCKDKTLEFGIGYKEAFELFEYIFRMQVIDTDIYKIRGLNTTLKDPKANIQNEGAVA